MDTFSILIIRNKWSIRLTAMVIAVYMVFDNIIRPPASLRHIPHLHFFAFFKALLQQKTVDEVAKETTLPAAAASNSGLYLRCDNLGWSVRVTRPESINLLLKNKYLFPKAAISQESRKGTLAGRTLIGPNVLFTTGDQWKKQRQIVNPAFTRSMPVKTFGRLSQKMIDTIQVDMANGLVDAHDISHRWALDALGATSFGFNFRALEDRNNEWVTRYNFVAKIGLRPHFFVFPFLERPCFRFLFPELRKAHDELTIFLDMMGGIARQKREALLNGNSPRTMYDDDEDQEKDLVTLMIEAEMQGQGRLTDNEIMSNLCVFFLAGHESTASAVAFAIYYLAAHPDVQQHAREEAIRVFGDGYDISPTLKQTRDLPYINMVIKESLRITPPIVSTIARVATSDTELAGVFIPKGTRVGLDIYELHRNPQVWKNPDTFDPERFAPGGEAEQIGGMPWAPFSSGTRQCIGMNFSLVEQRVLLPMMLRKFEWSLPENSIHKDNVVTEGLGVIRPKELLLSFKRRY
ncbi:cytochrome P450 [Fennellomyces sp. T-0311]|nr:cytochrome P450 [Fennellomyces sp. T-0311]